MKFREKPPMTRGIMGQPIPEPEFVFASCDGCDTSGYVPETECYVADENGDPLLCEECKDD